MVLCRCALESHLLWINRPSWITLIRSEGGPHSFQIDFTEQYVLLMSTKTKIFKVFRCIYQEHEESAKLHVKPGKHRFLHIFKPEHSMVIFHVLPIRLRFIKIFCWHFFYLKIVISTTYWVSTRDTMKKTDTVTALIEFTLWITICTYIYDTFLSHPECIMWPPL